MADASPPRVCFVPPAVLAVSMVGPPLRVSAIDRAAPGADTDAGGHRAHSRSICAGTSLVPLPRAHAATWSFQSGRLLLPATRFGCLDVGRSDGGLHDSAREVVRSRHGEQVGPAWPFDRDPRVAPSPGPSRNSMDGWPSEESYDADDGYLGTGEDEPAAEERSRYRRVPAEPATPPERPYASGPPVLLVERRRPIPARRRSGVPGRAGPWSQRNDESRMRRVGVEGAGDEQLTAAEVVEVLTERGMPPDRAAAIVEANPALVAHANPDTLLPLLDFLQGGPLWPRVLTPWPIAAMAGVERVTPASLLKWLQVLEYVNGAGVTRPTLLKMLQYHPPCLDYSVRDVLEPTVAALDALGVSGGYLDRVVRKNPSIFDPSVQLPAVIDLLRSHSFDDSQLRYVIIGKPEVFRQNARQWIARVIGFLMDAGVPRTQLGSFVAAFPAMLGYSVESNLRPKLAYLIHRMEVPVEELVRCPRYFGASLEEVIIPRHLFLRRLRITPVRLSALVRSSDVVFAEQVTGTSLETFLDFKRRHAPPALPP